MTAGHAGHAGHQNHPLSRAHGKKDENDALDALDALTDPYADLGYHPVRTPRPTLVAVKRPGPSPPFKAPSTTVPLVPLDARSGVSPTESAGQARLVEPQPPDCYRTGYPEKPRPLHLTAMDEEEDSCA